MTVAVVVALPAMRPVTVFGVLVCLEGARLLRREDAVSVRVGLGMLVFLLQ